MSKLIKVNDNFFDEINSEIKAYLLGFFIADGSLQSQLKSKEPNWLCVSVNIRDEYIVKLFKKYICPNTKIKYVKSNNSCYIRWTSKHMGNILVEKYKILPRKSYNLDFKLPIINENLQRHLIRGIIDGDGTVRVNVNKFPTINIVSTSREMLLDINKLIKKHVKCKSNLIKDSKNRKTTLYRLYFFSYKIEKGYSITNKEKLIKKEEYYNTMRSYIFENINFSLPRKKERFLKYRANL